MLRSSEMYMNLEKKQKEQLLKWLKTEVNFKSFESKSTTTMKRLRKSEIIKRKTSKDVNELDIAEGENEYVRIKATISVFGKKNIIYTAYPEEENITKVLDQGSGNFFCESNGKIYSHCEHHYTMSMLVSDESGSLWLTAFNGHADKITGVSA